MNPGVMMASHEGAKMRRVEGAGRRLKYVCRLGYGDSLPKDEELSGDIPVFGSNGQYSTTAVPNTSAPAIILGRKGSYGKVNWAPEECFASDTTFYIDGNHSTSNLRWLYWVLQTLRLDEGSQEAAVPGLNRESVYEQRVHYPDGETQRLIADYLDRETARIDALVAEKEKMLALLEEKRAALISRAVTRGLNPNAPLKPSGLDWLGDIPAHWEVTHFKYVCDLNPTVDLSKLAEDDEVTFLPMDRIKSGYYIENTEPFSKYNSSYNPFAEGDIVIAKVTPCFENGNIAIVENLRNQIGFGSSEIFVIRPIDTQQRFIFYYLQSDYFKQQGEASMTGAGGLKRVAPEFVRNHFIGLPPVEEQAAIAAFLDQQLLRMQAVARTVVETIALLKERRAALITAAVTGQIPAEEMQI